jgi:glucose/arabinose dehydrogenase
MIALLLCTLIPASLAHANAAVLPTNFSDTALSTGLDSPVGLALVPDPAGRPLRIMYVEQRTARVGLIVGAASYTVGVVPNVSSVDQERGLLGVVLDPDFPAAPYLYVHYCDSRTGNHIAISRFTLTGDLTDTATGALQFAAASRYDLRRDLQDNAINHNGGTVRFGPDKRLYVSLGDDATGCPAQDPKVLVGKILRLDVSRLPASGTGPAPFALLTAAGNPYATSTDSSSRLVWTTGLRNPFRFQIDPLDGALFIGDVGENSWEELDRVPAGGANMGWPLLEGPAAYSSCSGITTAGMTAPIQSYTHASGLVVIAAGVYRRPATGAARFPAEYEGDAFFLDYYSGMFRRLHQAAGTWTVAAQVDGQASALDFGTGFEQVSDVLQLPDGSLAYLRQAINYAAKTGEIRRIAYTTVADVPPLRSVALAFAAPAPTPSRGDVTLAWTQRDEAVVRLSVLDAAGREVRELVAHQRYAGGAHAIRWDGRSASGARSQPGVYFARVAVAGQSRVVRIVIAR